MMIIRTVNFSVLGRPAGKARAMTVRSRHTGKVHSFTPAETMINEAAVKWTYAAIVGPNAYISGRMFQLTVKAYFPIPRGAKKKIRALMESEQYPCPLRPDWDNIGKLVSDALNEVCWKDDSHVVSATVEKWYSPRPRVDVCIREIGIC